MRTEVKTHIHQKRSGEVVTVVDVLFLPRGSGNRNHARRLAAAFRANETLRPHLGKVVCGASKVRVELIPSLELMKIIASWPEPQKDVPGQLPLPIKGLELGA